jgi:hypothetical protein
MSTTGIFDSEFPEPVLTIPEEERARRVSTCLTPALGVYGVLVPNTYLR